MPAATTPEVFPDHPLDPVIPGFCRSSAAFIGCATITTACSHNLWFHQHLSIISSASKSAGTATCAEPTLAPSQLFPLFFAAKIEQSASLFAAEILGWSAATGRSRRGNSAVGLLSSAVSGVWVNLGSSAGRIPIRIWTACRLRVLQLPQAIVEIARVDCPQKAFDRLRQREPFGGGDAAAPDRVGHRLYRAKDVGRAVDRRQERAEPSGRGAARRCSRDRAATPSDRRRGRVRPPCGSAPLLRHRATAAPPKSTG